MSAERVIKKYANRRLYDAAASRHVTLDDIKTLIVSGEKIKAIDDKTGEDITRTVLLQIIAEHEQFGQPMLSTPVLESIIRFYGDSMQGVMAKYLEQSVQTILQQQQSLQQQFTKVLSGTPLAPGGEIAQQSLQMWKQFQDSMTAAWRPSAATASHTTNKEPDNHGTTEESPPSRKRGRPRGR